ncbi:MAG: hypothetical protein CMK59_05680 [Proteobacteria bacterium]|nr:hypothetical protein [Pseudomonadota bacterium]
MEILRLALSLFIVVCAFLSFRFVIYFAMKMSLSKWSRLNEGEQLIKEKGADLQIFFKKKNIHGHIVDKGYISWGKLILTDQRFFAVTHRGIVLEMNHRQPGKAKGMGPGRLLILGQTSEELDVRIEVSIEDEAQWETLISRFGEGSK